MATMQPLQPLVISVPTPCGVKISSSMRVRHAAVEDDRGLDAALDRLEAGLELGDHAAGDGAVGDQRADLRWRSGRGSAGLVLSSTPGTSVSSEQARRADRAGDGAGRGVGVDVVGLAVRADADRRDHRDDAGLLEVVSRMRGLIRVRLADEAEVDAARCRPGRAAARELAPAIRLPSLPERPTAWPPAALIAATICLLIEPARTISTTSTVGGVGDAQAVDERALDLEPVEHLA